MKCVKFLLRSIVWQVFFFVFGVVCLLKAPLHPGVRLCMQHGTTIWLLWECTRCTRLYLARVDLTAHAARGHSIRTSTVSSSLFAPMKRAESTEHAVHTSRALVERRRRIGWYCAKRRLGWRQRLATTVRSDGGKRKLTTGKIKYRV